MLSQKDLPGLQDLSENEILEILNTAPEMKSKVDNNTERNKILRNTSIVILFYENSTRTKMSFFMAGGYLEAKINTT